MPSPVTPTQWPRDSSASPSHPLTMRRPLVGHLGTGWGDGGAAAAHWERAQVPKGRQQRGHCIWLHVLSPLQVGGSPEWGAVAVPVVVCFVDGGHGDGEALGDTPQHHKTHWLSAPVAVQWRKLRIRTSSGPGCSAPRTCSAQVTRSMDPAVSRRPAGTNRVTWPSQRRRAGAESYHAIQRRVCCPHARHRPWGPCSSKASTGRASLAGTRSEARERGGGGGTSHCASSLCV